MVVVGTGGGGGRSYYVLPVNIISGRHSRSTEPGARLDDANDQRAHRAAYPVETWSAWGDGTKHAPFAKPSRFFDVLLNMAYLSAV